MNPQTRKIVGSLFCLAALLGWGMGSGRLPSASAMGALLFLASLSPYRVHATPKALSRSNDLTLVIIAVCGVWFYLQRQSLQTNLAIHLLSSCPFFLYPKLLFGFMLDHGEPASPASPRVPRDGVALARLWMEGELAFSRMHLDKRRSITFQDIYFFLAVFVATFSLPVAQGIAFAGGGVLLYCSIHAWSPRQSLPASLFMPAAAGLACLLAAAGGSESIRNAQEFAEDYYSQIWTRRADAPSSANSTETSIGRLGKLDNGSRLVMRLEWPRRSSPSYLRNGVFAHTSNGSAWYAWPLSSPVLDKPLLPSEGNSFAIDPDASLGRSDALWQAKISTTLSRARSAMALPIGSREIFGLPLPKLDMNSMGVPTTSGSQGFARYGVTFSPSHDGQPRPTSADTDIPLALLPSIDQFLDAAHARGLAAPLAAAAITAHFKAHWTYTLSLQDRQGNPRGLARFLLLDRSGHCEYFASATTLALRRLGFPARYSTGYLVREFDERENLYWIRSRDAHAWSSLWDGSSWVSVDSTPPGPPEPADWAGSGSDLIARFQYMVEAFDAAAFANRVDARWVAAVLALLLALLAHRLRFGKSAAAGDPASRESAALSREMARLGKTPPLPREASFDHWRRLAPLFSLRAEIEALALSRERALFMPVDDRRAALAQCEILARALRRRLSLAAPPR